eukprot:GHVL01008069.1.p1 GENE.GHVL01008069.1~~GHVL01008069.1.p1  ORF type:complete len:255 (+),score=12.15 GHVL01008069.1:146-910(+)
MFLTLLDVSHQKSSNMDEAQSGIIEAFTKMKNDHTKKGSTMNFIKAVVMVHTTVAEKAASVLKEKDGSVNILATNYNNFIRTVAEISQYLKSTNKFDEITEDMLNQLYDISYSKSPSTNPDNILARRIFGTIKTRAHHLNDPDSQNIELFEPSSPYDYTVLRLGHGSQTHLFGDKHTCYAVCNNLLREDKESVVLDGDRTPLQCQYAKKTEDSCMSDSICIREGQVVCYEYVKTQIENAKMYKTLWNYSEWGRQ